MEQAIKICKTCGSEYKKTTKISRKQWESRKFCSNSCRAKSQVRLGKPCSPWSTKTKKMCEICGVEISRTLSKRCLSHKIITQETRRKMAVKATGRRHTEEALAKMRGPNSPSWKGGITPENKRIRMSYEYKQWRKLVFERDDYTCQICKKRGVELHADHVKAFAYFPELRFEVSNGRALCVPCHKLTDNYTGKANKLYAKTN